MFACFVFVAFPLPFMPLGCSLCRREVLHKDEVLGSESDLQGEFQWLVLSRGVESGKGEVGGASSRGFIGETSHSNERK